MPKSRRRNVTVSIDRALVDEALELGLDLSAVAEQALRAATKAARRDNWSPDHTESGVVVRANASANSLRLAGWQSIQTNDPSR